MAALAWVMMAIAIWHFTVFLPDRFWAGIVGAFVWSIAGAVAFGFLIHLGDLPSRDDTNILTALEAVPGTVIGLGICWLLGVRQEERQHPADAFGRAS
ncbi:MAG TPA: hypothetical protein VHF89_16835 [Solirubrobacteraceae bacterium]|nr:hypothetical protein [Solirubrobacteraceae bacterium]